MVSNHFKKTPMIITIKIDKSLTVGLGQGPNIKDEFTMSDESPTSTNLENDHVFINK